MARPRKNGLDYFPHDVHAQDDRKLKAMQNLYGNDGYAFYFKILEKIYESFLQENVGDNRVDNERVIYGLSLANKNMRIVVRKDIGVDEGLFSEMIAMSLQLNLFNAAIYEETQVLTSQRIIDTCKDIELSRAKWRGKQGGKQGGKPPQRKEKKRKEYSPLPPAKKSGGTVDVEPAAPYHKPFAFTTQPKEKIG